MQNICLVCIVLLKFHINSLLDVLAIKECNTTGVKCGNWDERTKQRNRAIFVSNVMLSGAKSALVFTIGSRRIKITIRWHWKNFECKTLKTS